MENQIEMCRRYIDEKLAPSGVAEVAVYEDEGYSAKNMDRPQFQRMLHDLRVLRPDFVVCYRLDRISRSVSDFSALVEELERRNISIVCIKEEFDTSKPMGKAMMYIASVFAQLERETIAERVRDNMFMLARTGRWLGGTPPLGYQSERVREVIVEGKSRVSCQLKERPEELAVVELIFETFLEKHSVSGVRRCLTGRGIMSRSGKEYSLPGLKEILQNPVYCTADREARDFFVARHAQVCFDEDDCCGEWGLLAYHKRDYRKKRGSRQTMDQWVIAVGKHRGQISGRRWVEVQHILEQNIPTGKRPAKMHNEYALLSGLIYCGTCGGRMFAKRRSGGRKGYDYICARKLRGGREACDSRNLEGEETDRRVFASLMPYAEGGDGLYAPLEKLKRELRRQRNRDGVGGLRMRMGQCDAEMERLLQLLAREEVSREVFQRIQEKISALEQERTALTWAETHKTGAEDVQKEIERLVKHCSGIPESVPLLSIQEKRALIRLLAEKLLWDGSDLHVFRRGTQTEALCGV